MADYSGSAALVTGANRGIGLEVARQLARMGFDVILGARDALKGEEAAASLARGGLKVHAGLLDVTDDGNVEDLRRWTEGRFGRLDVLVNNAGALYDTWQRAENADFRTVREAFETNTLGPWRVSKAFIPLLRESGRGRIVNVSSESGSLASMGGGTPAYS